MVPDSGRSLLLSPVTRVIIFITLSITLVASAGRWWWVVVGWSCVLFVILSPVLRENLRTIALSCAWLGTIVALGLILGYRPGMQDLVLELLRLSAFIAATIVVFASLNAFEFTAALSSLGVPVRLALAVGTGMRFIPAFVEDIADVVVELRARKQSLARIPSRFARWAAVAERITVPLILNSLRTMEAITLSAAVHEIEQRVQNYRLPKLSILDIVFIASSIASCLAVIAATVLQ
jgi:energy-coupling factor transporter transmembrane protein EcfT